MFCPNCGANLPDDAAFCPECGTTVGAATGVEAANRETLPVDNQVVGGGAHAKADAGGAKKGPSKAVIVLIIVLAAALVGGLVAYFMWKSDQDAKQAAWNQAHQMHAVVLSIAAPGFDSATDTGIPIHVTGMNLDGESVDQTAYIASDGSGLSLQQGTYTAAVAASPLMANATLFGVPAETVSITVDQDGAAHADGAGGWTFAVIDPVQITDDQIAAAYKYAQGSGAQQSTVDDLKTKTISARDAAVAQKKAEEEAAAAAAEAQRQAEAAAAAQAAAAQSIVGNWWYTDTTSVRGGYGVWSFKSDGTAEFKSGYSIIPFTWTKSAKTADGYPSFTVTSMTGSSETMYIDSTGCLNDGQIQYHKE